MTKPLALFIAGMLTLPLMAADQLDWQAGTVTAVKTAHRKKFNPYTPSTFGELEILSNGVRYAVFYLNSRHKVDLVPALSILTQEKRRHKTLDLHSGSPVRISISGGTGWIMDDHNIVRKLVVRGEMQQKAANQ